MSTTIPISNKLKGMMERFKGDKTWDEFLEELLHELYRYNRERNKEKLGELFASSYKDVRIKKWAKEF